MSCNAYAKTINLGGWYITNDVALGLHTSFEHAEGIKNLYGNTIMGANDSEQYYEIPNDNETENQKREYEPKIIRVSKGIKVVKLVNNVLLKDSFTEV